MNTSTPHAFALFSGGLDSILAARLIMEQGLVVRCLHFVTPFFGKPQLIPHWEKVYGLEVEAVDVGEAFVRLLRERPAHGFGKVMNPCVDCKILMMRKARELMKKWGASFLISGEVLGQRPMSQRRDTLNVIRRDAEVKESLLRPLSAQLLDPTAPEISGLVDRNKLLGIFGRRPEVPNGVGRSNGPERDPHTRRRVQTGGKGKLPALLAGPDAPQRADG